MKLFSFKIDNDTDMDAFNEVMWALQDVREEQIKKLSEELDVSIACASDVIYLRTRSRWTEEKEKELIDLHAKGSPPNIFDF